VTVTGVADNTNDGDVDYTITTTVSSDDAKYDGFDLSMMSRSQVPMWTKPIDTEYPLPLPQPVKFPHSRV
jgi:hypothetical protein